MRSIHLLAQFVGLSEEELAMMYQLLAEGER